MPTKITVILCYQNERGVCQTQQRPSRATSGNRMLCPTNQKSREGLPTKPMCEPNKWKAPPPPNKHNCYCATTNTTKRRFQTPERGLFFHHANVFSVSSTRRKEVPTARTGRVVFSVPSGREVVNRPNCEGHCQPSSTVRLFQPHKRGKGTNQANGEMARTNHTKTEKVI